jgi:membrane-bound metal-dependent hydrolase YbcI (DUF457 family)
MMARGHFLSGLTTGLLSSPVTAVLAPTGVDTPARALALSAAFSALVGVGALWPDIDHKPALISKIIPGVSQLVCWVMRHLSMAVYEATRTNKDREGGCHRTFTHTLPFVLITGGGVAALMASTGPLGVTNLGPWAAFVGVALGLGTLVHILGDAMTLSGVPVRWPLLDKKGRRWSTWGFRWFRAGGPVGERIATLVFTGLTAGLTLLVLIAGGAPWWSPVFALIGG